MSLAARVRTTSIIARRRSAIAAIAAVMAVGGTTLAYAAEPVADNPQGAAATVDSATVVQGGTITFHGTGFTTAGRGEVLGIRIDDKAVVPKDPLPDGSWGRATAANDGTVSATIDLSRAHPDTPILPGRHWIRLLTGTPQPGDTPRTLHVDFTVTAPPVDPGVVPSTPGTITPGPTTPTTPVSTTPAIVRTGPIWTTETTTKPSATKVSLKVKAGAVGSAGKVSIRTIDKFKVGKGKAKRWQIAKSDSYFVEQLKTATLRLKLTPEGKTLIKRKKVLKVTVTFVDANGDDTVSQEVWVTR